MIGWNSLDITREMNKLFSPAGLASQVCFGSFMPLCMLPCIHLFVLSLIIYSSVCSFAGLFQKAEGKKADRIGIRKPACLTI